MFEPHFFPQCCGFSPDPLPLCSSGPLPTQLCSVAVTLPATGSLCHVFVSLDLGNAYCVLVYHQSKCHKTFLGVLELISEVLPSSRLAVRMTIKLCCFDILYLS